MDQIKSQSQRRKDCDVIFDITTDILAVEVYMAVYPKKTWITLNLKFAYFLSQRSPDQIFSVRSFIESLNICIMYHMKIPSLNHLWLVYK